jgi:coenzyme PQQ precursor peptide PqqA
MSWTKPDFQEITLNMEVTAYVHTDGAVRKMEGPARKPEEDAPEMLVIDG